MQQGARTPSSASLSTSDSVVWAGKKIGGKKQDHSPALILLPMIHPLRSATPLNSKAGHGARTPSSAGLFMTNSTERTGKKMGGKKGDGFSCLHSPANDPFTPFCRSIEFQGRARSADALVRFPLYDQLSRDAWQKDGWQKMDHSPANDPSVLPTPERDSKAG